MLRRLACAIGWHVPKLRSDAYGYYRGCVYCDFADTPAVRTLLNMPTERGQQ
jgi:hypothetical protein